MNESKVPYTYIGPNGNTSHIDHLLISDIMSESVIDCSIIDDYLLSDHLPVMLSLDFNISHSDVSKRPPMWLKRLDIKPMIATLICISLSLMNNCLIVFIPNELMLCKNVNCTVHNHDICELYHRVIDACLKAGEYIPSIAAPKQNNIQAWNDLVETHKREALTWHRL